MNSAQEFLKEKQALGRNRPVMKTVSLIPTAHMGADIAGAEPLSGKENRSQKGILQQLLKEVRARGSEINLTYKLPLRASESRFFTLLRLVGPPGLEPEAEKKRGNGRS
jgi:hypothetical protein